tara:strand:+ start:1965 stop:2612 length:648 start_codon:yes stop_codon:yes gene_type:complete
METEKDNEAKFDKASSEKTEITDDIKEDNKELIELDKLQVQLKEKVKEIDHLNDRYLRLQAETENFKRRIREEKIKDTQFANERLIKNILPIYENLCRALESPDGNPDSLKQGVDMIFKEFTSTLEKEKVKPIPTVGVKFDPVVHEALSQIESNNHDEDTVLQEVSKGFFFNDRVLLPARVVISKKSNESEKDEEEVSSPKTKKSKAVEKPQEKK